MLKRPTLSEHLYPSISAATIVATWNDALINRLLECVWVAYDSLHIEVLASVDFSRPSDDLERELTEKLFQRIQRQFDFSMPVYPMHAFAERESRPNPPGQPPLYDIAFVLNANDRLCWALEAKVLDSDANTVRNLGDYVKTFNERFLACRYAPFSPSAAMLGYLKTGNPNTALDHLTLWLSCTMASHPKFPTRVHRTSEHTRVVESGSSYPSQFRCHHLMMPLN